MVVPRDGFVVRKPWVAGSKTTTRKQTEPSIVGDIRRDAKPDPAFIGPVGKSFKSGEETREVLLFQSVVVVDNE